MDTQSIARASIPFPIFSVGTTVDIRHDDFGLEENPLVSQRGPCNSRVTVILEACLYPGCFTQLEQPRGIRRFCFDAAGVIKYKDRDTFVKFLATIFQKKIDTLLNVYYHTSLPDWARGFHAGFSLVSL